MTGQRYPSVPLPAQDGDHHIRVLDILPGLFHAELRLALRLKKLSDSPQYEALSYTWGATTEGRSVVVNDTYRLPVTDNLYRALLRLRYRFTRRTLWIDAICIDQANYNERAAQVAIMGAIYKSANRVVIWLGEPTSTASVTRQSFEVARTLYGQLRRNRGESIKTSLSIAFKILRNEHLELENALQAFTSPWYERVWVIQETMRARRVCLLFGANAWGPNHPSHFIYGLGLQDTKYRLWTSSASFAGLGKLLDRLKHREAPSGGTGEHRLDHNPGIVQRIPLLRTATATDERDMVYSMLSLINDEEASLMSVDYTLSVGEVFAIATYASIRASHAHTLLQGFDGDDAARRKHIASWAFDFTSAAYLRRIKVRTDWNVLLGTFRPGGCSQYTLPELDETLARLTISGVRCGEVVKLQTLSELQDTGALLTWVYETLKQLSPASSSYSADAFVQRALAAPKATRSSRDEAWWYLDAAYAVLDRRQLKLYQPGADMAYLFCLWDDLAQALLISQSATLERLKDQYLRKYSSSALDKSKPRQVLVEKSALFALDNGLIGLAPDSVTVGDEIIAVPCEDNGTSPFLTVRPCSGGRYQFLGLVYVHGCMHEEFWNGWTAIDESFQRFVLQ